jgi:hypothetical protein
LAGRWPVKQSGRRTRQQAVIGGTPDQLEGFVFSQISSFELDWIFLAKRGLKVVARREK